MDDATNDPHRPWDEMVAAAVLGTGRTGHLPAIAGDLAFATAAAPSPDLDLLRGAAALSVFSRAVFTATAAAEAPSTAARCEVGKVPGPAAAHHLSTALGDSREALLVEWCALAREGGYVIPPQLLPAMLRRAERDAKLRPLIEPILGPRGLWLAEQNADWRGLFAGDSADADTLWQNGTAAQRLQLLRSLASADRARARSLIESTWDQDDPENRAKFLKVFADASAVEDEPLLERALDDKRKAVRDEGVEGLARLERSAFSKRMRERLAPLISFNPGAKPAKGKKSSPLEITLPPEPDAAGKRDGLVAKARNGVGPQAAVLSDLIAATPLAFWQQFQVPPPALIDAAVAGEYAVPLLDGWQRAAVRQRDADWAEALLRAALASKPKERLDQFLPVQHLIPVLPPHRAEGVILDLLGDKDDKTGGAMALFEYLQFPWSESFSRAALAWMRGRKLENDYGVRYWLNQSAGLRIHPSLVGEAASGWPDNLQPAARQAIDQFLVTLQFRSDMHKELKP